MTQFGSGRLPRRTLVLALHSSHLLGALSFAVFLLPARQSGAACNVIPSAAVRFRSAVGSIDRPFAGPGDVVELGGDSCTQPDGIDVAVDDVVVSVAFRPPRDGGRTVLVLIPDDTPDDDVCQRADVQEQLAACSLRSSARVACRELSTSGPLV